MTDTSPKSDHALGYVPNPRYSQEDWDEVCDNPPLTDAEIAELRPVQEVPEVYALLPKRRPGRPRLPDAKVNLTLRVDPALLDTYRATGPGWQVRMHEALVAGATGLPKAGAA